MMFRTRPKLLTIMQMAGASGQLFTADQVVYFLGKYIEQKKLYDPVNKRLIKCSNDLLGEVFKVSQFTVTDFKNLWKLIFPCLIPATRREMSSGDHVEQKQDEGSELPWWFFIKKENDPDDVATEGGSYADGETVGIADTDVSDSDDEEEEVVEYEPFETDSDATDDTEPFISDNDLEPTVGEISTLNKFQDSDDDTHTTDFSMDSDILLEDYWPCEECSTRNPPTIGYCQRCWKLRKGWSDNAKLHRSVTDPVLPTYEVSALRKEMSIDVCDGKTGGNSFGEPLAKRPHLDSTAMATSSSQGSTTDSIPSSSSSDPPSFPGLCNICRNSPNDAIIIHQNTGHQFCCYRCAKTLKKKGKNCPVCRQPIMLVIRNFIVQF